MGTYTTNYNLFLPSIGEQGWGELVNNNFSTIDTAMKGLDTRLTTCESTDVSYNTRLETLEAGEFETINGNNGIFDVIQIKNLYLDGGVATKTNSIYTFTVGSIRATTGNTATTIPTSNTLFATSPSWKINSSVNVTSGKATLKSISSYTGTISATITHPSSSSLSSYTFYLTFNLIDETGAVVATANGNHAMSTGSGTATITHTFLPGKTYHTKLYGRVSSGTTYGVSSSSISAASFVSYW